MRLGHRAALTGSLWTAMVSQWTRPGLVISVQAGTINLNGATSGTATITAVTLAQSLIFMPGMPTSATVDGFASSNLARIELTNTTTVTASRFTSEAVAFLVPYVVVQFAPGVLRTVSRGTMDLNGVTSQTATISPSLRDPLKAIAISLGVAVNVNTLNPLNEWIRLTVTSSTVVTGTVNTAQAVSMVQGYQVVEWY